MPDYLFTSQFEYMFFLQIKRQDILWEWERKKHEPHPRRPRGRPLSHSVHGKVYCVLSHIESCMWTSQQTSPWFSITASGFWTCWKPPRDWLWLWDCWRPLRLVVRCFCDRLRLSRSTIYKMVRMSLKTYVELPGIFCQAFEFARRSS